MLLQGTKAAIALQLQESWWRELQVWHLVQDAALHGKFKYLIECLLQVLPGRTHPAMMMSSTGGYVLSGIKVVQ